MMDLSGRVTDYLLDVHYASIFSINEVFKEASKNRTDKFCI